MGSCDRANVCWFCASSWDMYTQTRNVMHFYDFFMFFGMFIHLSFTFRIFVVHFLALNFQNLSFDCGRKSTFRRSVGILQLMTPVYFYFFILVYLYICVLAHLYTCILKNLCTFVHLWTFFLFTFMLVYLCTCELVYFFIGLFFC